MTETIFPENIDVILLMITAHETAITFIAVFLFIVLKDKLALRYASLCAAFYVVGYFSYSFVISLDNEQYILRYVIWAFNDIVFMAILAYWALKDKVYIWQSILVQLIILPAPLLQLFRLVDMHVLDTTYSSYLYKTILPLVNISVVLMCFAPLLLLFQKGKFLRTES